MAESKRVHLDHALAVLETARDQHAHNATLQQGDQQALSLEVAEQCGLALALLRLNPAVDGR